jgi:hypothetical protein
MRYVVCMAMALICSILLAQTPSARAQFEVASVKAAQTMGRAAAPFP